METDDRKKGIFTLRDADGLFKKLERDYERLRLSPHNVDAAFDFFVTGYHLLDWRYPGKENEAKRRQMETSSVMLQVLSHVANGSKHFELRDKRHKSIVDSGFKGGVFNPAVFNPQVFDAGSLTLTLQGEAAQAFGDDVSVQEFAQKVFEYWSGVFKT